MGFSQNHESVLKDLLSMLAAEKVDALVGVALPQSIGWEWTQRCFISYSLAKEDWSVATEESMSDYFRRALDRLHLCAEGDMACHEKERSRPIIQNSWILLRKSQETISFVDNWLRWNVNDGVMEAMPFADQSLFELLAHNASTSLALKAMTSASLTVHDTSPTNQLKHLGMALNMLEQHDDPRDAAEEAKLIWLSSDSTATWRLGEVELGEWRRSVCRA
eukprot:TRINITY_DN29639_c0_g2_i1.p1 TRINITY_DN29639_c0_g2~~TRINITY_DN29639_c0_g2_i1.p1  ORF type:complete len:238 (+),score=18.33 TRINITY_DN29639_c0_g2_i1:56-715(+)